LKVAALKLTLATAVLPLGLLMHGAASAQTPPSAGSLNQQIEREQLPRPAQAAPEIRVEQGAAPATPAADHQKILVKIVRITGAQLYPEATLLAVAGFSAQRELTLTELRAIAAKIAGHYRKHGYFLAQAYLPAQDIKDGMVTIAVLEGKYGQVSLRNGSHLSDGMANGMLAGLHSGDTVAIAPLESRILSLSDIPGVNVKSTLAPGASVGASDLIVELTPGQRVTGSIDADNQGNRYTGTNRLGAALTINNPSGYGDLVNLRALTSDAGQHYGRAAYQAQIGRAKAGVAYSHMEYRLGKEFASLGAHGTASIASLYGSYPLIRSRIHNLNVLINLDAKTFRDRADAALTVADKSARVAMLTLSGDTRDSVGDGGLSTYALTWSTGSIDIKSPAVLAADAATVRSNGHYDKLILQMSRLQSVTETISLYAAVNGQFASKNLDASEKIGLGGVGGVRAYPSGEAYGDQGYLLTLEARMLQPKISDRVPGQMQVIGFIDTGSVTLNKNPWAVGPDRRTLSGAGIGVNWVDPSNFVVSATLARKLGNAVATSAPDASSRFWIQAVKYF
jgi:hemolysin activation/secretion protein